MSNNDFQAVLSAPGVDLTGQSPANLETGEIQTLNPPRYFDRHFLVPSLGPFFAEGVKVVKVGIPGMPDEELHLGTDYFLTHKYAEATYYLSQDAPPRTLYASISFYDPTLVGQIKLDYQYLGGPFKLSGAQVLQLLADRIYNPRIAYMEQITGAYVRFPPTDHPTDANTIEFGFTEVAERLRDIRDALLSNSGRAIYTSDQVNVMVNDLRSEIDELRTAINNDSFGGQ